MKCPYCGHKNDRVLDSRAVRDGEAVRRRRECQACGMRFTSYEHIEQVELRVIKKSGEREPYDRSKVLIGIQKACEKRNIPIETMEAIVDGVETEAFAGRHEARSRDIGEAVMNALMNLDEVAYVRFASVYRQFADTNEFLEAVSRFLPGNARKESREEGARDGTGAPPKGKRGRKKKR
ncbi:MAG: transcriptional regulator NrdR [bacterium]